MFCIRCGKENQNDASFCKYCGAGIAQDADALAKQKRRKRILLVVGIMAAILAVVVPIGVCLMVGQNAIEEARKAVEIVNSSMTYDESGYAEVTGRVRNTGNSEIPFCRIIAKFYDADGTVVDTGTDYLYNIGAGEQAQFTILCGKEGTATYEVYVG